MASRFLCLSVLGFQAVDALNGNKDCVHQVLTGIDNLFGVCGAQNGIVRCSQSEHPASDCKKQVGPGGNLITQDITEDVTLGKGTAKATHQWHKAFQACTKGRGCSKAVKLYKPVLKSVQHGLAALIQSHSCQASNQLKGLAFSKQDFADCSPSGEPDATSGLMKVTGHVLHKLPRKALKHFPAHDINVWFHHHHQTNPGSASEGNTDADRQDTVTEGASDGDSDHHPGSASEDDEDGDQHDTVSENAGDDENDHHEDENESHSLSEQGSQDEDEDEDDMAAPREAPREDQEDQTIMKMLEKDSNAAENTDNDTPAPGDEEGTMGKDLSPEGDEDTKDEIRKKESEVKNGMKKMQEDEEKMQEHGEDSGVDSQDANSMLQIGRRSMSVPSSGRPSQAVDVLNHARNWLRAEPVN